MRRALLTLIGVVLYTFLGLVILSLVGGALLGAIGLPELVLFMIFWFGLLWFIVKRRSQKSNSNPESKLPGTATQL